MGGAKWSLHGILRNVKRNHQKSIECDLLFKQNFKNKTKHKNTLEIGVCIDKH